MTLTRRALLTGAVAVVAAGCRPRRRSAVRAPDPDADALTAARAAEQQLVAAYDAMPAAAAPLGSALAADRAAHAAHVAALTRLLPAPGATAAAPTSTLTSAPTPTPGLTLSPRDVTATERASVATLQAAAVAARRGAAATVLASIAASHAAMGSVRASIRVAG